MKKKPRKVNVTIVVMINKNVDKDAHSETKSLYKNIVWMRRMIDHIECRKCCYFTLKNECELLTVE